MRTHGLWGLRLTIFSKPELVEVIREYFDDVCAMFAVLNRAAKIAELKKYDRDRVKRIFPDIYP